MKKGKLYTANKYNQTLFARGVDRERENVFDGFMGSSLNTPTWNGYQAQSTSIPNVSPYASVGAYLSSTPVTSVTPVNTVKEGKIFASPYRADVTTLPIISNAPINKTAKDLLGTPKTESNFGNIAKGVVGAVAPMVGSFAGNAISGGFNTGAGSAISSIGSTIGGTVGAVNPLLGAAISVGSGLIGGLTNRAFGHQENEETKATVKAHNDVIDSAGKAAMQASSNEDVLNAAANAEGAMDISKSGFKNGWFNSKGDTAYNNLLASQDNAISRFGQQLVRGAASVDKMNDENIMRNFFADGGLVDMPSMGGAALDYGFMSDYINAKNRANSVKDKMPSNVFGSVNNPTFFALGGDVQSNGADFTTGLSRIDAGGSHEENPYDGVQVGISKVNGKPNLVEEGETIFDDYVYSKRIMIDAETKRKFHVGKKAEISYADLSKKLEKEAAERPNDAISQRGLEKQLHDLADEQERQKGEMQGVSEGEPLSTTTAGNEEMIAMEPATNVGTVAEGGMPIGEGGMGEEGMGAEAMGEMPVESVNMSAEGGNLYPDGGSMKERIYKALGFYLPSQFEKWAKDNNVGEVDWEKALENQQLIDALKKSNPALGHSIGLGNDFGVYQPSMAADKITVQSIANGNWKFTNGKGWKGSEDLAFKQATEGLSDAEIEALTTEQLAERMKNTAAYKNTSKWLQNKDNALLYLNTLLNDKDTPQIAKDYALKFVKDGKWKDGFNYDYATVFGKDGKGVRETNPGTYWHSVVEANRGKKNNNYFIHDDGSIEAITGDVPTDLISAGSYSWKDAENDNVANYFKKAVSAPAADAAGTVATDGSNDNEGDGKTWVPNKRSTVGRGLGLMGPIAGITMMANGIGKPDYSEMNAAVSKGSRSPVLAAWRPVGNYMKYSPFDEWSQQNRSDANARATDRLIMNNSGTLGSKMSGWLANAYINQLASADLSKKAKEYNNGLLLQALTFNNGTDVQNANSYNQNSATNAGIINAANQQGASLAMNAAQQKMAADAGWNNSLYGNVNNLFKGLGQWGKENEQYNMIAAMAADGLFGNLGKSNVGQMYGHWG